MTQVTRNSQPIAQHLVTLNAALQAARAPKKASTYPHHGSGPAVQEAAGTQYISISSTTHLVQVRNSFNYFAIL